MATRKFFENIKFTREMDRLMKALGEYSEKQPDLLLYSYADLQAATNNFSPENLAGDSFFGAAFKGHLRNTVDGADLVVVQEDLFQEDLYTGPIGDFHRYMWNEVYVRTKMRHPNIDQLKGWCIDNRHHYCLVHEYVGKSLATALLLDHQNDWPDRRKNTLYWQQRFKICEDIARGLSYLHEQVRPHVIHRAISPRNILLDDNYNAKITEFSVALYKLEDAVEVEDIVGSSGIIDPEYLLSGKASPKIDVYNFGIVLLNIVSGRVSFDLSRPEEQRGLNNKYFLLDWAVKLMKEGRLLDLLDPTVRKTANYEEVFRVIYVALLCSVRDSRIRPKMSEALSMLQGLMDLPIYKLSQEAKSDVPR